MGRKSKSPRAKRIEDKKRKQLQRKQLLDPFFYHPTDTQWRQTHATELGILLPNEIAISSEDNASETALSKPAVLHHTSGDGNCFFSSLSFAITGREQDQDVLRCAICQHLVSHQDDLRTYLPSQYNGDATQYLAQTGMENNATWATEVEIFTAAHMLRTNIYVYTQHGVRWTWLRHSVGQTDINCSIYLYHRGRCHYDVVLGISTSDVQGFNFSNQLIPDKQIQNKERMEKYKKDSLDIKERDKKGYDTDPIYCGGKKGSTESKYSADQEKRKTSERERYRTDPKSKYSADQEKKNTRERERYRTDPKYREKKKKVAQEKYTINTNYREKAKRAARNRYDTDTKHRERKKRAARERYYALQQYRDHKRHMSILKYASNSHFRLSVRRYASAKYKQNSFFRDQVKQSSKMKYKERSIFREKVKQSSKTKYKERSIFREKVKQSSKTKYKERSTFRGKVKQSSKTRYKERSTFREKVKQSSKTRYKENSTFRQTVKEFSKHKYTQFESFRKRLRASCIRKYALNPLFRSKLKKFLKEQYHQKQEIRLKKKQAVNVRRKSLSKALMSFRRNIRDTPRYPCTVCARLLYKKQVKLCQHTKYMHNGVLHEAAEKSLIGTFQYDSKEWICLTCDRHLTMGNMPPQALANGLNLQPIPNELKVLNHLERQVVALRIPFMKLLSLPRGGQRGVKGQVVNVPSDLNSVTTSLPRTVDSAQMIKVKLKRKRSYKGHQQYEWVNPQHVIDAITYLTTHNSWYSNIKFNGDWFDEAGDADIVRAENPESDTDIEENNKEEKDTEDKPGKSSSSEKVLVGPGDVHSAYSDSTEYDTDTDTEEDNKEESDTGDQQKKSSNSEKVSVIPRDIQSVYSDSTEYDTDTEEDNTHATDTHANQRQDQSSSSEKVSVETGEVHILYTGTEVDNKQKKETKATQQKSSSSKKASVSSDEPLPSHPVETCCQPLDLGQEYLDTNGKIFCVAPGENQTPQSIFQEKGADAMAFPSLLPDGNFGFSADRQVKLSPSKYFSARLFCADDRFAKDNLFIFFAQFMVEISNIKSNISIALRKGKKTTDDGKKITASMLTNADQLHHILKSDAGFRFLQPVRGTPPYWQRTMKDLYAMIRQLGIPTWFVTFSAGETRWKEVIEALKKDDKRDVSEMEWVEKCQLIKENPVMCARLFNHRVQSLFIDLIMSPAQPIGNVVDFFYRTEFQQRGSPHIHCLFWVKNAPKLDENSDATICSFVDKYISCQKPDQEQDKELYDIVTSVQMHSKSHTKSCKKNSSTCRFRFPRPPIKETFIAKSETEEIPKNGTKQPSKEEIEEMCRQMGGRSAKEIAKDVWTVINSIEHVEDYNIDDIPQAANVTYPKFVESLKAIASRTSVYHRRSLHDSWVNNYNPLLLKAWNANMDIQYVMDAYSCVAYILSYISKAEAEVGKLISDAKKEATEGNKDAASAMKQIGHVYIQNRRYLLRKLSTECAACI